MNVDNESSRSLWMEIPPPDAAILTEDIDADILVIGAGIAGLSVAYELMRRDCEIVVIDRGHFGRGQSARTSAHLSFESDDYYKALTDALGRDRAQQFLDSQRAAVDRIEAIAAEERIDCDFARLDAYLFPARDDDVSKLEDELKAALTLGFPEVAWLEPGDVPGLPDVPAIRFSAQARFHPLKYLDGLVEALRRSGARLFHQTAVEALDEDEDGVLATCRGGYKIRARQVVVATNSPINLLLSVHTKQAPYRSYIAAFEAPKGAVTDALFWDTETPGYHYVRLQPGETQDVVIVGGEDHKTGEADDGAERIERLEAWVRSLWPKIGERLCAWSGQVYEPADYAPYIGKSPDHKHVWLVSGDSGEGLTTGAAAGLILCDLIEGKTSPWAEVYDPGRKPLSPGPLGDYIKENAGVVKSMTEHVLHARNPEDYDHDPGEAEVASLDDIKPGQGALCRHDGKKIAAYRDAGGYLHLYSAACTHAGCIIHWNSFETCWDCPCHGSQFDIDGQPLQGPAVKPLSPVEHGDETVRTAPAETVRQDASIAPEPGPDAPAEGARFHTQVSDESQQIPSPHAPDTRAFDL